MIDEIEKREGMNANDKRVLHEVMQQLALAGLYRGGFFDKASFYGGTCLRIVYNLRRFSEDMDFSLDAGDPDFDIEPFFQSIRDEFESRRLSVEITKKKKKHDTAIESAFLKSNTQIYELGTGGKSNIRIKLEVDTDPPKGFKTESKLINLPFMYYAKCYKLSDLYAGKMHALIYRNWKNRVKGRDWYDFVWYVQCGAELNLEHFASRVSQSKKKVNEGITKAEFIWLLSNKISSTDIDSAKKDVANFVYDERELDIWSEKFFLDLIPFMKFV
jgi:predicted nucleotidyltransferase component of viral defense system